MDARREFFDDVHALGGFQCGQYLRFGGVGLAQPHIVQNAALEQPTVLEHEGDGVHQLLLGNVPHVRAANADFSAAHVEEANHQAGQGGFAAAGGANQRHGLPRLNVH